MTQKLAFAPHRFEKKQFKPLNDHVIVKDMNFTGRQLSSGIIMLNDNGKAGGIRPRWAQVYAVGPDQSEIKTGQWICVAHGRWTRGVEIEDESGEHTIRRIDHKDILLVSDEEPGVDDTMSNAVSG
jgi:co-chaperonin GroES (HSP10)